MRRAAMGGLVAVLVAGLMGLAAPAGAATSVDCSSQNLQNKINTASPGSTLLIKGTCIGTFTVNEDLTLKGNPSAILDGDSLGITLRVLGSTAHLSNLAITGGLGNDIGGGIGNFSGTLTLDHVAVHDNAVIVTSTDSAFATGAGIGQNGGSLTLTRSQVFGNRAYASGDNSEALAKGAGISSEAGAITLTHSVVRANRATAVSSAGFANSFGAGISQNAGSLTLLSTRIEGNRNTSSGPGSVVEGGGVSVNNEPFSMSRSVVTGNIVTSIATAASGTFIDASASGGGIVARGAHVTISRSSVTRNRLTARSPGTAIAQGGAIEVGSSSLRLSISNSSISRNTATSVTDAGLAQAFGGGVDVFGRRASVRTSTLHLNQANSGSNASDAEARGGGINVAFGSLTMSGSTVSRSAAGARAGASHGAFASGAGLFLGNSSATDSITNSTIANGSAIAAAPPDTGSTFSRGGGILASVSTLTLTAATVAGNVVTSSSSSMTDQGGGLAVVGGATVELTGTMLARNVAPSAPDGRDCSGSVSSHGHNLVGKSAGCTGLKPTDMVDVNPKLGTLANNGGLTKTMALHAGSPAIDAIPNVACAVPKDQRGVRRPQGPRCDIGAYERRP